MLLIRDLKIASFRMPCHRIRFLVVWFDTKTENWHLQCERRQEEGWEIRNKLLQLLSINNRWQFSQSFISHHRFVSLPRSNNNNNQVDNNDDDDGIERDEIKKGGTAKASAVMCEIKEIWITQRKINNMNRENEIEHNVWVYDHIYRTRLANWPMKQK